MPVRAGLTGFLLFLLAGPVRADDVPWLPAGLAVNATSADIKSGGIAAIASHADALEKALADGALSFPPPPAADGSLVVLTDGATETLAALAAAASQQKKTVAHPNPYPVAALYLALYYNEVHGYDAALRVLDQGLKLMGTDTMLGDHVPAMLTERATAYAGQKRFDEALTVCDKALALKIGTPRDKARFDRCRGFDLTELNRLDDAQAAYNDSLTLEPNNPLALRELGYIARLRAGGKTAPAGQMLVPSGNSQSTPSGNPN